MKENIHSYDVVNNAGLLVADNVSAMLAYWDKDLLCRYANIAYLEWFGKKSQDMIGTMTLPQLLGPDLYSKNKPYIDGALAGIPQTFEREIPIPGGKGTRPSLANYFPHVVDGEVLGFVVHVADVSAVKTLEAELIRSNRIVNEQNKRLLNFANIVSHNLGSYANNLQILLDLYDSSRDQDDQEKIMQHLRNTAASFSSTVRNLNAIVEVQNLINIPSALVNVHDYVETVCNILRAQISASGGTVENLIDPELTLDTNPAYIESILLNLLSNAVKYRHPSRHPVVTFESERTPEAVLLKIKDNGLGIDLVKHERNLFGMYKTFHSNKDAKGIGLFITKFQVEAMGGSISVESEIDKGSVFLLRFPV